MKISIALGVYNGEAYLKQQLESFLWQTRLPDELVVGNDCSSDMTNLILDEFSAKSPFPVNICFNEKNLGIIRNFDETIARCSGDIIFPSDHDDVWMPSKIEKIAAEFEKTPKVGLVFTNAEIVDENLNPLGSTLFERIFPPEKQKQAKDGKFIEVLLERNVVGGATSAFRAEYRKFFSPIPTHLSMIHDGWIVFILASLSETSFLTEALIKYRQHSRQGTKAIWGNKEKIQKVSRREICQEGIDLYRKKEQELKYLLETLDRLRQELPENEFIKKATNAVQTQIQISEQAGEHFSIRKNLPTPRFGRFYQVGREALTGRYHKFSNGFASVAKDLIYK